MDALTSIIWYLLAVIILFVFLGFAWAVKKPTKK